MGKLLCESSPTVAETLSPSPPLLTWQDATKIPPPPCLDSPGSPDQGGENPWNEDDPAALGTTFRLSHGGDVEADGNCLFTASRTAMGLSKVGARELRQRTKEAVDAAIRHLYSPDLKAGWGIHVVQEVKLLAMKADREILDTAIQELLDLGLQRENAAESIYKERCIAVNDASSWAKYMSISGSPEDEYDIITLQYTEEGLLTVQAHGLDAMVDEDNCIFFLPHHPRGQMNEAPFFLFMKGTGWCGAGADHYEPLISHPAPLVPQEKAAFIL
ncbi:unnamed protein product [Spirodela intermedia]|uniref:Uncharacterized protein n=1 Tax=Spirodela intermedia TaxID=51605 RepID=A0A7I8J1M5_SPIIN|nr:unnamed protein product [Spirodela intermedia]CAA6664037.1 unnamed protein product [Spirodela intermedia]